VSAHNDAAFLRMFLLVLGALVAFTIIIMFAAGAISSELDGKQANDSRAQAAIVERIKPVGKVEIAKAGAAPAAPKPASQIVAESCNACHASGVLGAPKVGDKAAWEARLAGGGVDGLTESAIKGKGNMPPRGGAAGLSDADIHAAVVHMLKESGANTDSAAAAPVAAEPAPAPEAASVAAQPAPPVLDLVVLGKSIYDSACMACHMSGVANAPRLGDKAAWAGRIAQGIDTLMANALHGKGGMPPKGGRLDLSDDAVKAAVAYMLEQSQ
jgi:cytochrome c5